MSFPEWFGSCSKTAHLSTLKYRTGKDMEERGRAKDWEGDGRTGKDWEGLRRTEKDCEGHGRFGREGHGRTWKDGLGRTGKD